MKMNFQVMMLRSKRSLGRKNKIKSNAGWKHVAVVEYITAAAARREEANFFSLFHRNFR
jgi:hypothetical protein